METTPLSGKITMEHLRQARQNGEKFPMLTCYDFTMAQLMEKAGVPGLLVGDSAANVILGHPDTRPIRLDFLIDLTAAVRRRAPKALLVADMPFGSYQESTAQGVRNSVRMLQLSACDCIKLEVADGHAGLVRRLADAGVAVMAHLGLRPQSIGLLGGYKARGRTAKEAGAIVKTARRFEKAGAAALLLEAVPPEVAEAVVQAVGLPVIGCGAGPACHGHVIVTHDAIGFNASPPRFVPKLANVAGTLEGALADYVRQVRDGKYPAAGQTYEMPAAEKKEFLGISKT